MTRIQLLFLTIALLIAGGCVAGQAPEPLYEGTVSIGAAVWPGYTALYVADGKGFFVEEGLNVEIAHYPGTVELSRAYSAARMQGRANLTLEAIQEQLDGMQHKVVLAIDYSNGSDAIVARNEIQTVAQLEGMHVAFEEGGLEEFFLTWALEEYGLTLADITPVPSDPQGSAAALETGEADAAVTYEPSVSRLEATGQFHRIYTSSDAPGLITDILTFRTDFVEEHPETIEALLRAYFRGYRFWQEHPDEANAIVADVFRQHGDDPDITVSDVAQQQNGVHILDLRDNRTAFSYASGLKSLYGNMRQLGAFVRKHRGADVPLTATDHLIEPRFIRRLARSNH